MEKGFYPEVARLTRTLLAKEPENPRAYYYQGLVLFRQGQTSEAKKYFEKALDLDPEYGECNSALGVVYWSHKEFAQAEFYFMLALRLNSKDIQGILGLARLYRSLDRHDAAVPWLELAAELEHGGDISLRYELALEYLRAGWFLKADILFQEILSELDRNPNIFLDPLCIRQEQMNAQKLFAERHGYPLEVLHSMVKVLSILMCVDSDDFEVIGREADLLVKIGRNQVVGFLEEKYFMQTLSLWVKGRDLLSLGYCAHQFADESSKLDPVFDRAFHDAMAHLED